MAAIQEKLKEVKPELKKLMKIKLSQISEVTERERLVNGYGIYTETHGELNNPYLQIKIQVMPNNVIRKTEIYLGFERPEEYTIDEFVDKMMTVDMIEHIANYLAKTRFK